MSAPGSPRVVREWQNRVRAEYGSAALTAELLHWLLQLGVSPDTLKVCHRIVDDELVHAELSREVYLAAGGSDEAIALGGARLTLPHGPGRPLLERALLVAADVYCCGETVARPLFREMRRGTTQPLAAKALDRIIKDEARHSELGWALLEELLERADEHSRRALAASVPSFMQRFADGSSGEAAPADAKAVLSQEDAAWGLLTLDRYRAIARQCVEEKILPRFRRLGALA